MESLDQVTPWKAVDPVVPWAWAGATAEQPSPSAGPAASAFEGRATTPTYRAACAASVVAGLAGPARGRASRPVPATGVFAAVEAQLRGAAKTTGRPTS